MAIRANIGGKIVEFDTFAEVEQAVFDFNAQQAPVVEARGEAAATGRRGGEPAGGEQTEVEAGPPPSPPTPPRDVEEQPGIEAGTPGPAAQLSVTDIDAILQAEIDAGRTVSSRDLSRLLPNVSIARRNAAFNRLAERQRIADIEAQAQAQAQAQQRGGGPAGGGGFSGGALGGGEGDGLFEGFGGTEGFIDFITGVGGDVGRGGTGLFEDLGGLEGILGSLGALGEGQFSPFGFDPEQQTTINDLFANVLGQLTDPAIAPEDRLALTATLGFLRDFLPQGGIAPVDKTEQLLGLLETLFPAFGEARGQDVTRRGDELDLLASIFGDISTATTERGAQGVAAAGDVLGFQSDALRDLLGLTGTQTTAQANVLRGLLGLTGTQTTAQASVLGSLMNLLGTAGTAGVTREGNLLQNQLGLEQLANAFDIAQLQNFFPATVSGILGGLPMTTAFGQQVGQQAAQQAAQPNLFQAGAWPVNIPDPALAASMNLKPVVPPGLSDILGLGGVPLNLSGVQSGQATPFASLFPTGLPTLGLLNQIGAPGQGFLQALGEGTGTSAASQQRQSAGVTPRVPQQVLRRVPARRAGVR